ncbi:MAG: YbaB/EbfC family nucleoid-associated protein [Candidatus Aminicenantes bacterium]|nr:YbaB/EbfC family nucleoid-associated protein [Candidatus Aminicenantes bacterium]HHF51565.1 YbaB/EbfC family nucleoid-associated protein [Candidatus Aminicenantes bacterium]
MKGVGNLQKMLKQAKEMQEKIKKELDEMRVEGSSGGGMVDITMDGNKNIVSVKIDPEVVNKDDVEMLQDLISAAFNDACAQVDDRVKEKMGALGAGLKIPGLS